MHPLPDLLLFGLLTFAGFYLGKLARRARLPSLIGYMLAGVAAGPSLFDLCAEDSLGRYEFISEIALGLVAFTIGSELSLRELRRLGRGIVSIIFAESFGAFFAVLAGVYLVALATPQAAPVALPLSLLFASMAPASAPAGTVAVIQEYRAKGSLTTALYAVVGFDDGLAILIFGFAAAAAKTMLEGQITGESAGLLAVLGTPAWEIALSLAIGAALGVLFCFLARRSGGPREYFILAVGTILVACGLSTLFHLSLILTNLVIGFVMVNTRTSDLTHRVAEQIGNVMPLIFILFFVLAGAHLQLASLPALGGLGLVYILCRSAGLLGGSRLGALYGGVEEKIRKYVGLGILSQAGVAIGLALIVKGEYDLLAESARAAGKAELAERIAWIGSTIITSITATCIVFEVIGPICAKIALTRAGEIPEEGKEARASTRVRRSTEEGGTA